ncbi:hypothetical protein QUF74_03250 [Candidatus Halobeggiatoa sp. HSG11]|nr:hypothetical protein [Candidatus Halobeggiatoa sp. HSG11]
MTAINPLSLTCGALGCLGMNGVTATVQYNGSGFSLSGKASSNTVVGGVDIDGDGNVDIAFWVGTFYNSIWASCSIKSVLAVPTGSGKYASNLGKGDMVGTALSFKGCPGFFVSNGAGNFVDNSTGYLGVKFNGANGIPGTQYAWIKTKFSYATDPRVITIIDWAYDDSGAAIRVGDTGAVAADLPAELSMLNLLGLGAIGLAAFRRRRDKFLAENEKAEK